MTRSASVSLGDVAFNRFLSVLRSARFCKGPDLAVLRGERDAAGLVPLRRGRSDVGSARAARDRHQRVGVPWADRALG